jgi:hypothetical protein
MEGQGVQKLLNYKPGGWNKSGGWSFFGKGVTCPSLPPRHNIIIAAPGSWFSVSSTICQQVTSKSVYRTTQSVSCSMG